jgi:hypothetical protein
MKAEKLNIVRGLSPTVRLTTAGPQAWSAPKRGITEHLITVKMAG